MGLTMNSMGKKLYSDLNSDTFDISGEQIVVLAGNPNVGKSTLFNAVTGLNQHTGNWSGKTVGTTFGKCSYNGIVYSVADIPGCYSLKAESAEEACAAEIIRNRNSKQIVVVCDACSLERNLNLVLQICEITDDVIVALNFMDAAAKKGIHIDVNALENKLGVPVIIINARKKQGINRLFECVKNSSIKKSFKTDYGKHIEYAVKIVSKALRCINCPNIRYFSLRLLENDETALTYIKEKIQGKYNINMIYDARHKALNYLYKNGIGESDIGDIIAITLLRSAHNICKNVVLIKTKKRFDFSQYDKILTGKYSGIAVMFLLLMLVFYITLKGANYPSMILTRLLFSFEKYLLKFLYTVSVPKSISRALVYGGYRILSWVVSVMLPPMAIFFPLFTILEDVGYLPRIAFNLDKCFKKCNACGKQSLTTCMAFGCNAAGITGARIIDSPREKLIAILTNSFIPCNGRFPSLIAVITIFLASQNRFGGVISSLYLLAFIVLSVLMSLFASKLLSSTLLKGMTASFALELPPYRKPQFGQIIIRSVLDRTIYVLGRAVVVAFPAGIVLYILSNCFIDGISLIEHISNILNPVGQIIGLDGVILTAFILGIPANEIVLPIALMIYSSGSLLSQVNSYSTISSILVANGWNVVTAVCFIVFVMFHWPCSTTLMTVKKETGSIKWAIVSFVLPTVFGIIICFLINILSKFIL